MLHVIPDDDRAHETTAAGCWCGAQLRPAARGDGSCRPAMVHYGPDEPRTHPAEVPAAGAEEPAPAQ